MKYTELSQMTIFEYHRRKRELKGDLQAQAEFNRNWKIHKDKLNGTRTEEV
jgi:hypothetical protein